MINASPAPFISWKFSAHPVGKAENCSANGQHTHLGSSVRAAPALGVPHCALCHPPLCQVPSEDICRWRAEHVCQVTVVPPFSPPSLPILAKICSILLHGFIPSQASVIPCHVLVRWLHPTLCTPNKLLWATLPASVLLE